MNNIHPIEGILNEVIIVVGEIELVDHLVVGSVQETEGYHVVGRNVFFGNVNFLFL